MTQLVRFAGGQRRGRSPRLTLISASGFVRRRLTRDHQISVAGGHDQLQSTGTEWRAVGIAADLAFAKSERWLLADGVDDEQFGAAW